MSYRKVVDQVRRLYHLTLIGKYSIADIAYPKPFVFGIAFLSGGVSIVPKDPSTATRNSIDSAPPTPQHLQPAAQLTSATDTKVQHQPDKPTTIATAKFVPPRAQRSTPQRSTPLRSAQSTQKRQQRNINRQSAQQHSIDRHRVIRNTATQNTATQNTATQNTATQNTGIQNTATQNTATQNTATRNTATQNTATRNIVQSITPRNIRRQTGERQTGERIAQSISPDSVSLARQNAGQTATPQNLEERDRINSTLAVLGRPEIGTENGVIVMRPFSQAAALPVAPSATLATQSRSESPTVVLAELAQTTADHSANGNTISNFGSRSPSNSAGNSASNSSDSLSRDRAIDPELGDLQLQPVPSSPLENPAADPELGVLQLQPVSGPQGQPPATGAIDPALENLQQQFDQLQQQESGSLETATSNDFDPELGNLQLQPLQTAPPPPRPRQRRPRVFLQGGVDFFGSSNIFLRRDNPLSDQYLNFSTGIFARPALGPRTDLILSASGNLLRYNQSSDDNISGLQFRTGIRQYFSRNLYGQVSVSNRQSFEADGDRSFNNYAADAFLSWYQPLNSRLTLEGFYQFQALFNESRNRVLFTNADQTRCLERGGLFTAGDRPQVGNCRILRSDPSRISNTAALSLTYNFQPNLQLGLDYSVSLLDYTQQDQFDDYHQVTAQLSYSPSRQTRISFFGGVGFGGSTNQAIDYDNTFLGVSLRLNVPLF